MPKIYIGFSAPNKCKVFAEAIKLFQGTKYSHVYTRFYIPDLESDIIFQASGVSVNFMYPDVFRDHNVIIREFELDISNETLKKVLKFATKQLGKPYGMKHVLGILIARIRGIFGQPAINPYADGEASYVCSELVGEILKEILDVQDVENLDVLDPKGIYLLLERKLGI